MKNYSDDDKARISSATLQETSGDGKFGNAQNRQTNIHIRDIGVRSTLPPNKQANQLLGTKPTQLNCILHPTRVAHTCACLLDISTISVCTTNSHAHNNSISSPKPNQFNQRFYVFISLSLRWLPSSQPTSTNHPNTQQTHQPIQHIHTNTQHTNTSIYRLNTIFFCNFWEECLNVYVVFIGCSYIYIYRYICILCTHFVYVYLYAVYVLGAKGRLNELFWGRAGVGQSEPTNKLCERGGDYHWNYRRVYTLPCCVRLTWCAEKMFDHGDV